MTVNLTRSIEEEFEERAARAQFLAQQSSVARDPLLFASAILREQALLAHALESAALTGNLDEDVETLLRLGKTLLHGAAAHGPEALAQEARKRIDEDRHAGVDARGHRVVPQGGRDVTIGRRMRLQREQGAHGGEEGEEYRSSPHPACGAR